MGINSVQIIIIITYFFNSLMELMNVSGSGYGGRVFVIVNVHFLRFNNITRGL